MSEVTNRTRLISEKRRARQQRLAGIRKRVAIGSSLLVAAYGGLVLLRSPGDTATSSAASPSVSQTASTQASTSQSTLTGYGYSDSSSESAGSSSQSTSDQETLVTSQS
jgi:hypothetical protein